MTNFSRDSEDTFGGRGVDLSRRRVRGRAKCPRITLITIALALVWGSLVLPSDAKPVENVAISFSVPAQSLESALLAYSEQSGIQLLMRTGDVQLFSSNPLMGPYSAREALAHLLEGTGLGYRFMTASTVIVWDDQASVDQGESWNRHAAQFAAMQAGGATDLEQLRVAESDAANQQRNSAIDEIVVTGSYIRGRSQIDSTSPLKVFRNEEFRAEGATGVTDIVKNLSVNSGSEFQVDSLSQPLTSGTASFNLRNLGLNSTLVLINGRRQAVSAVAATDGSTFVDTNSLVPVIMIDRFEILKDGAAAIYGSDAVAGVVNFITRNEFEGFEINTNYMNVDDSSSDEVWFEGIFGHRFSDKTNFVVAASYFDRSRMSATERSFSRAETFEFALWHAVSSYGQPGSFFVPSRGDNGEFVPDPDCLDFEGAFQSSPTDLCRFDFSPYFDLSPDESRSQVYAVLNHDFSDNLSGMLEISYAKSETETTASPSFPFLTALPTVPASHPDNIFNEDVRFRGRILGAAAGASVTTFDYDTYRVAGELEGTTYNDWYWTLSTSFSRQEVFYDRPDTLSTPTINALMGLGGPDCDPETGTPGVGDCQWFNPFGTAALGSGTPNSRELVRSLIGSTGMKGESQLFTVEAVVSGELLEMSSGALQAAFGVQYRDEQFSHDWSEDYNNTGLLSIGQAPDFSASGDVFALFAELSAPLLNTVEVQLAGRYEKYDAGVDSFDPKLGVLWRPLEEVAFRASIGTAFRAPSLYQSNAVQASQPFVIDDGSFVFINVQTFGNANLKPEEATVFNLGVTLRPFDWAEFNVDYWSFDYDELIVKESAQAIVNQANADTAMGLTDTVAQMKVERTAAGSITRVLADFLNASSVKTDGLDVELKLTGDTSMGTFELSTNWTYVMKYDIQQVAGGPVVDGAGLVNFENFARSLPEWRGTNRIHWVYGNHEVNAYIRYVDSYRNDRVFITDRKIESHTTLDLQYIFSTSRFLNGSTRLTIGTINITDEEPPSAQLILGFDPITHDPRGRIVYVSVGHQF